mgnify:FL=1
MPKHIVELPPDEKINLVRTDIPSDFHGKNDFYFQKNYLGQLRHPSGKYYSNHARRRYYHPDERKKHLAVGQWVGYRWVIQNYSEENDFIFDPTCGSGTALVEAYNNKRHSAGIELEFFEVALMNTIHQQQTRPMDRNYQMNLKRGSALSDDFPDIEPTLIINGPPYPILRNSNLSSDIHESTWERDVVYDQNENLGNMKDGEQYWSSLKRIYTKCFDILKPNGYLCILIKDPIRDKKYYPLSEKVADLVEQIGFVTKSSFLHRHIPSTLFMHTYPKKFPEVSVPLYQTGMIYQKIS